jgi:hypothetical protein
MDSLYVPGAVSTAVLECCDAESQEPVAVQFMLGKTLEISVIIKLDNRRKHNSHEWFLSGFGAAHAATATYLLLTDTGTHFAPRCLAQLAGLLRDDPDEYCAAVAFQRPAVTRAGNNLIKQFHGLAQRYEVGFQTVEFELLDTLLSSVSNLESMYVLCSFMLPITAHVQRLPTCESCPFLRCPALTHIVSKHTSC